jgi:hypothetical protein
VARGLVVAEPGAFSEELDIPQDTDGTGFVWPANLDPVEFGIAAVWMLWWLGTTAYIVVGEDISPVITYSAEAGHALFCFGYLCRHFLRTIGE